MAEHHGLMDAFAEARRTWDDLIALQPDIMVGSGMLKDAEFDELRSRVEAHAAAVHLLSQALAEDETVRHR